MATKKREYGTTDAAPVVLYAKTDTDSEYAFPIFLDTFGTLYTNIKGYNGTNYHPIVIDPTTRRLCVSDDISCAVHEGKHFFISDAIDLSINNVLDVQFTTLNTTRWKHFTFTIECESETNWWIYEGVTILTVGTTLLSYNNNRNSALTSSTTIANYTSTNMAQAVTVVSTASATQLRHGIVGSGRTGGGTISDKDMVLKQNTIYGMRAEAAAAGYISFFMSWVEIINEAT